MTGFHIAYSLCHILGALSYILRMVYITLPGQGILTEEIERLEARCFQPTKTLKIPFGNVFEGFLTRFLNYICIFKALGVVAF
jgi:hypothetical protein